MIARRKKTNKVIESRRMRIVNVKKPRKEHKPKRPDIELGLDIMLILREPGQTLDCVEMAEICGCSNSTMTYILRRAVMKFMAEYDRRNWPYIAEYVNDN